MKYFKFYFLTIGVIAIDQLVKMLIHFNMPLHSEIPVIGNWFKLHYTLNPGMAFGLILDWEYGKLFLTLFRLVAMVGIIWYMNFLANRQAPQGLLWCMALILGGAVGNVIDSTFYGVFFPELIADGATTPWFHGQVIDMFYFDIWKGELPAWLGGGYTSLFPIFNVADSSIFIGVVTILVFQRKYFSERRLLQQEAEENVTENEIISEDNPEISPEETSGNLNQSIS
jgi:signal peptidase II